MKNIFSYFIPKSIFIYIAFFTLTNSAFSQFTFTENFENESTPNNTLNHTFSESGISFQTNLKFETNNQSYGYGASSSFISLANVVNGIGRSETINITGGATSFTISSFAAYVSPDINAVSYGNGDITFIGNLAGGGTATAIINVPSSGTVNPPLTREANGVVANLSFAGTDLAGKLITSLEVRTSASIQYIELDHISFILDNTPPTVSTGSIANCFNTLGDAHLAALSATIATDNFPGPVTKTASTDGTDCNTIITVTCMDLSGNTSTTTYNTKIDNIPPVINCPANIIVCGAAAVPPPNIGLVSATDNCLAPTISHVGDIVNDFSTTEPYSISRTYSAVDLCNNTAECIQIITVYPVLTSSPGNVDIAWTGLASNEWADACNWLPAWVPDFTNRNVIINPTARSPIISGNVGTIKAMEITGNSLAINNGGILHIIGNGIEDKGLEINSGATVSNFGSIKIASLSNNATLASIYLRGTSPNFAFFSNNGNVEINSTDSGIGVGLSAGSTVINYSTGIINIINGTGIKVGAPTDQLSLNNFGIINYNGSDFALSLQGNTTFDNSSGTINVNSGLGISTNGTAILNTNGKIIMNSGNFNNQGTTYNAGYIKMPNAFNFINTGTFTNDGLLKANSVSGITNNKMVISNSCPIFTIGGANNYIVNGIYVNAGLSTTAGDYTLINNKFTAKNSLPSGPQTLFADITNGSGSIAVPFDFNNSKPTTVAVNKTSTCIGSPVILSGGCTTGSLTWYTVSTGGVAIGTGNNFSHIPAVATTYYAACETSGCASSREATNNVTILPLPTVAISEAGITLCQGSSASLTATSNPNYSYAWSRSLPGFGDSFVAFGGTANTQIVSTSGVYKVVATDPNSCIASDTVGVRIRDFSFSGSLGAGDAQQTGRLNRFSNVSTCAAAKPYPGNFTSTGARYYDSYTVTNIRNVPVCATIGLITGCGPNFFSVVYQGSFNPTSLGQNYLADPGLSFSGPGFYEVNIPANGTIVLVIHELNPGQGCANYTVTVELPREAAGITVTPNSPVFPGATVALQASTANTYVWSNGGNTKTININAPATTSTYNVNLGYGNVGCSATANAQVQVKKTTIKSIISGNWENASTWESGQIPELGVKAIIDANHTVTVTTPNAQAKEIEYRTNARIIFNALASLKLGL